MYVVKVGEYYVRTARPYTNEIILSKEIMTGFAKENAEKIAQRINGEVVKIAEEVTNEWKKIKG